MVAAKLDKATQGAWLLSHSKSLDTFAGASRLESIAYAGKIGRLYNVLRRGAEDETSVIEPDTVTHLTQLNGIDLAARREGLRVLQDQGRIDISRNGAVAVLGATSRAVLETTSEVFEDANPSSDELAAVYLSEMISSRPIDRDEAEEFVEDNFKLASDRSKSLIELCKSTAILDEEKDRGRAIVFNSNVFRDGKRATKAYFVLQGLDSTEQRLLREADERLTKSGAIMDKDIEKVLGSDLFRRLLAIGYYDRMEVNNPSEAVGYIALPDAFQRYGKPFEEDPVDDAKALLASLTYGMTRSGSTRGNIRLPVALLNALIDGRPVGPVAAIGQDYKELERRGVVHVFADRYAHSMTLLKKDVGELALAILQGSRPAEEALLMAGRAATGFKGPNESRQDVRSKNTVEDRVFQTDALDRIRAGG